MQSIVFDTVNIGTALQLPMNSEKMQKIPVMCILIDFIHELKILSVQTHF